MASKGKGGKLREIRIKLHHAGDGGALNDGFEIEHHHFDTEDNRYLGEVKNMGMATHHGDVMEHIHEHIKNHGTQNDELSGQPQSADGESEEHTEGCVMCDDPDGEGNKQTREAKLHNVASHGYEKGTPNAFGAGGKKKAHPGFKKVEKKIAAKEGLSQKAAGAILASRTRGASAAAHKANPHLNRVKG